MLETDLLERLRTFFSQDDFWASYLENWHLSAEKPYSIHLAIFVEPYLSFVLDGSKTVESRFSVNRCAPYGRVNKGDILLLKRSGGPILGVCQVGDVWAYELDPDSWQTIRKEFTKALCVQDPVFWEQRENASYVTLMRVQQVRSTPPLNVSKRDRRGWVVLADAELANSKSKALRI